MKPILVFLAAQRGRRKRGEGRQSLQYSGTTHRGEQSSCEKAVPDRVSVIQEATLKAKWGWGPLVAPYQLKSTLRVPELLGGTVEKSVSLTRGH